MDLLAQIAQEGAQEADRILADAKAQAREREAQAASQAAADAAAYRETEGHRIEQERRLIVSRARAQARAIFLKAKGQAAESLFDELLRDTAGLRRDPQQYRAFLERCLREAERAIPGPLVLQVDPADEAVMGQLIQGTPHRLSEARRMRGGFIATDADGDLVLDDRLETRIANLRQQYRSEIGKALFDQAG